MTSDSLQYLCSMTPPSDQTDVLHILDRPHYRGAAPICPPRCRGRRLATVCRRWRDEDVQARGGSEWNGGGPPEGMSHGAWCDGT